MGRGEVGGDRGFFSSRMIWPAVGEEIVRKKRLKHRSIVSAHILYLIVLPAHKKDRYLYILFQFSRPDLRTETEACSTW